MLKRLAVVVLSSLALACGRDETRLRLTTAAAEFTRVAAPGETGAGSATIPYEVTNLGEQTAYLPTCGGALQPSIDRWDGSSWSEYAGPYCLANLQWGSARLVRGASVQGTASIAEAGTYRIRFDFTTEQSDNGTVASDAVNVH